MTWDVVTRCVTAMRFGPDGMPIGLDWVVLLPILAAAGIDARTATVLLPEIELGMITAMREERS